MTLGAKASDVLSLVMNGGFLVVTVGTMIGMAGARLGSRMLSAMNSSVGRVSSTSTSDPTILIGAPLLAMLALIACYIPARRSLRIDPAATLRQE